MNSTYIINVKNLSMERYGKRIFEKVSFSIKKNEFVSLKGPSGCGKTTLLRILTGLTTPTEGVIRINGIVANDPEIVLQPYERKISLLFQDLALWPHMKGIEQLEFVWQGVKIGNFINRVNTVCKTIGLPSDLLNKYPHELSRGEQQRLAIVRTIITKPDIIFFDEPLTALDLQLRSRFVNFLNLLKKERNTTVIIVSHDLMMDLITFDREVFYTSQTFKEKMVNK